MKRFLNKLKYVFLKRIKPEIIGGWKNANGVYQEHTGISNMTHISQSGENLYIGDNVFIGHFNYIDGNNARLTIGDYVEITNYVNSFKYKDYALPTNPFLPREGIVGYSYDKNLSYNQTLCILLKEYFQGRRNNV